MRNPASTTLSVTYNRPQRCVAAIVLLLGISVTGDVHAAINSIREVLDLTPEEAATGIQTDIEATVYFHDPYWQYFFIGQGNDFICVNDGTETFTPGTRVRLRGKTETGIQSNLIVQNSVEVISRPDPDDTGNQDLVDPFPFDLSESTLDDHDCAWVSIEATVEFARLTNKVSKLVCVQGKNRFHASLPWLEDPEDVHHLIGAHVRLTGSLGCRIKDGKLDGISLNVPKGFVEVVESAASPLEVVKCKPIGVLWNDREATSYYLSGQVTFAKPNGFFLETPDSGTYIHHSNDLPVAVGDFVDIYGRRQIKARGGTLHLGIVTNGSNAPLAKPEKVDLVKLVTERPESRRVCVAGSFDKVRFGIEGELPTLYLTNGDYTFEARCYPDKFDALNLETAHEVEVTGTVSFYSGSDRDFVLYVPSINDIAVIVREPVFNALHVIGAVAFLSGLIVAGLFWGKSLTTQVQSKKRALAEMTAQLNLAYDSIREGILIVSPDQKVVHANRNLKSLTGAVATRHDSSDAFAGQLAPRLVEGDFLNRWSRLQASETVTEEMALQLRLPDGQLKSLEVFTTPVKNESGEFVARLWAFHDLTEKEQMQETLLHAQKQEAIGRLAGGFAHDFNNLLTGIQGNLFVAQIDPEKTVAQVKDSLSTATGASARAAKLVSQLLCFSRKSRLQLRSHDVNEIVSRTTDLLRPSLSTNIECELQLAENLPGVTVDDTQIEQVLLNICLNAVDAISPTGAIRIESSQIRRASPDGVHSRWIVISIRDTGVGMPAKVRDRMFEPFFTTKLGQGTGLGLSMSEGIINQHGGWIECDSEPDVGTEFRVYLPKGAQSDCSPDPIADQTVGDSDSAGDEGEETIRRVLVVDDDELVRKTTAKILMALGADVDAASGGEEAMRWLAERADYDLVLLDWSMPGMHGKEVLQRINQNYPSLPTIICSGYVFDCDEVIRQTGVAPAAVIQKPFSLPDIARHLKKKYPRIYDVA